MTDALLIVIDLRCLCVLVVCHFVQSAPNRKLLMSLLSLLNCDVVGAENGRIAVDLFAGQWAFWAAQRHRTLVGCQTPWMAFGSRERVAPSR